MANYRVEVDYTPSRLERDDSDGTTFGRQANAILQRLGGSQAQVEAIVDPIRLADLARVVTGILLE
jgi:hypothetical protein